MPALSVNRQAGKLPNKTRGSVSAGEVFSVYNRAGQLGRKAYAALGKNGRLYSVNIESKELASTANSKSTVAIVGKFKYTAKLSPSGVLRTCRRSEVREGEIFQVGDEPKTLYLHMGFRSSDNKLMSVNLVSGDVASTANGGSTVHVVGSGEIVVERSN